MSEITNMSSLEEFEEKVTKSKGKVMLYLSTTWCGPCKAVFPIVESINEEISKKDPEELTIFKIDADNAKDIVGKLGVRSVPTMVFYKDGEELKKLTGSKNRADIISAIESL